MKINNEFIIETSMSIILACCAVLLFGVILAGICAVFISPKTCAVYSELKEKRGFAMAGKVAVPTRYMGRDCLVWKDK